MTEFTTMQILIGVSILLFAGCFAGYEIALMLKTYWNKKESPRGLSDE